MPLPLLMTLSMPLPLPLAQLSLPLLTPLAMPLAMLPLPLAMPSAMPPLPLALALPMSLAVCRRTAAEHAMPRSSNSFFRTVVVEEPQLCGRSETRVNFAFLNVNFIMYQAGVHITSFKRVLIVNFARFETKSQIGRQASIHQREKQFRLKIVKSSGKHSGCF
jgi:hypothetical protein